MRLLDTATDFQRIGASGFVLGRIRTAEPPHPGTLWLRYAAAIAAEVIQVFVSNPRAWALSAGEARQDEALREHVAATGLPVYVHAPYLINVGSPDPVVRERSAASLAHSLRRGTEIGARGVVVHTGSAVRADRATAMRHVRACLLPLLESIADGGPDAKSGS